MSEKFSLPGTAEICITLPVSLLHVVVQHLRRGVCSEVYDVLTLIYMQFDLQVKEARKRAEAAMLQQEAVAVQSPSADTAEQASKTAAAAKLH
jgi:hypothetical protein